MHTFKDLRLVCCIFDEKATPTHRIRSTSDCGSPTAPEHGTVTLVGTETTFQATATQSCDTGYNRSPGSGTIACLETGSWSASFTCSVVGSSL